ncbi:ATP phosphoribosyltransferase [Marinicella sp. S1101]|uniref:ATP phosphoribosyltransferase n=1 Tax=Marinicella marina TaxID=2996016 RepID=UPI002260F230|nr:ATP phosphoribosyltransferase [Marinicella marina]MCX7553276.1 ATP phosphoribosyltransferase [Marinicella marina]MDJ1139008.1 ATP phosphoribosyltransferase [Marinicella marina]
MKIKMAIPKGKLQIAIDQLLADIGINVMGSDRNYRPGCNDERFEIKLLKGQNIPSMVELGQHDIGFAGLDWIAEQGADVEIIKPLGFNPVQIVACIPEDWDYVALKQRKIIVATEYMNLAEKFLEKNGFDAKLIRSYGATEVFPPEDADMIIDNTSTGTTIKANRLKICDVVYESATQFFANKQALQDPEKKAIIDDMLLLINGVMNARQRVLLEMNCQSENIEKIVALLPAMRSPTVSQLFNSDAYSVRAAIMKNATRDLIPKLKQAGATDILELPIRKVV